MAGSNGQALDYDTLRRMELDILEGPLPVVPQAERERLRQDNPELLQGLPPCYGPPCTREQPCRNCQWEIRALALLWHREKHGEPVYPDGGETASGGPACGFASVSACGFASAEPLTAAQIILAHYHRRYRPVYRDGAIVCCHDGRRVVMAEAIVPNSLVIDQLAAASNAPTYRGGGVNHDALVGLFNRWARVAWGDLLASLDDEDSADLGDLTMAAEQFRRLVCDAMLAEVVLGETIGHGRDQQTRVERRSLIGWCQLFARPGPWRQIRSKQCWCKLVLLANDEILLRVAIRHELFAQLKADRRLCEMGANLFGRRAQRYGTGASSERDRPHGKRAVVLAEDLVSGLIDTLPEEEEEAEEICRASESADGPAEGRQKNEGPEDGLT